MKQDQFLPNIRFLPKINSPADLKAVPDRDIPALADEIRQEIIGTLSENGGHLASNLGMVEATLALHRTFSCTAEERTDTIVFDVGHQCYTHKLLTGRYDRFRTIRQNNGLSGFTNRSESPYDAMTCGHSGSSISAAMGIAEANRLNYGVGKNAPWTVAVVGDGSFTNGMIYEALNSLAGRPLNLIILLNDNEMSISKNVGGLSKYLAYIRTSESYFTFKLILKRLFSSLPLVGNGFVRAARAVRDFLKRVTNSETFFENLGLEYIGPADGNDYRRMLHVLEEAKSKPGPVIVHIKTKKGMGYPPAMEHPERFHSAAPFDLATGQPKKSSSGTTFTSVFSENLCSLAGQDSRICAITAAMTEGCGLAEFSRRFPDRFFDVGIAEEHAAALAGGLAIAGMTPVLVLYSTFAQRVFDQLWHDIRLQNVHTVLVLSHCGLVPGDGVTHQGLYDVSLFRSIPEITVYSPAAADDLRRDFDRALAGNGLCIVRYPKDTVQEWENVRFTEKNGIYKCASFGASPKILVVTYGRIAHDVAAVLADENIPAELVVLDRILPLPADELKKIADSVPCTTAVVVEEGVTSGGIGEAAAAILPVKTHIFAVDNPLIPHGSLDHIKKIAGLDRESLAARFRAIL